MLVSRALECVFSIVNRASASVKDLAKCRAGKRAGKRGQVFRYRIFIAFKNKHYARQSNKN